MSDVTQLLNSIGQDGTGVRDELLVQVYQELRKVAAGMMAREAPGHTLQPTALVHEVWLRIVGNDGTVWKNRAHFFGAAGEAMRRILVEQARRRHASRRGGGQEALDLDGMQIACTVADEEALDVHDALDKLAAEHPRKAELVKLRYFAGFSLSQAAEALAISEPTAKRDWSYARAWLGAEIRGGK